MDTSRRNFLKNAALVAAGATLLSNDLFASPKKIERVGIQLYSVREAMGKDPLGSLKKIADMEYQHVEHANYVNRKFYGYSAQGVQKNIERLELTNAKRAYRDDGA